MSQAKAVNEFKIGFKSNLKDIISQCQQILSDDKGDKEKVIHLSGICPKRIGEVTIVAEILKTMIPGLSQNTIFSVKNSHSNEKSIKSDITSKKIYPMLEVILFVEEKEAQKNSSSKISEDERTILIDNLEKMRESKKTRRTANNRRWRTYSGRLEYSNSYRRAGDRMKKVGYNYRRPFSKIPNGFVWKGVGSRNVKYTPIKK